MHGKEIRTEQRQLETLFIHVADSQSLVPNQMFLPKTKALHVLSFPNSGNSSTSEVALPPNLTDMDLSVHVPNGYLTVIFNGLLS